jgi:D-inositol-3-phosphate glycosyltransferase
VTDRRDLIPPAVGRVALLSVHTSPMDQPGSGDGGGLNVYVVEVATRLARRGIAVDVFTRATDPTAPRTVPLAPGVDVHTIEAGPVAPLPKDELANHLCAFTMGLLRHPTAGTHDLVHAHYWLSGWVGRRVADRWDVPFVQTFHTLGVLKNATLAPGDRPESPLRLAAERRIARSADRILALTCGEGRLLHRAFGVSGARMSVVPAGVDLDTFGPTPTTADLAARSLAPDGDGPLLLFVGRLQPLKGPDIAVRTLARLRRTRPDARLLIVGGTSGNGAGRTGPRELGELATDLGVADAIRVLPARPQRDLAALYRLADVVVVPSRSETFGLVALEAQACGTPVVAAGVDGLTDTVGAGGTLVAGHDPADHARAVEATLADPDRYAATVAAGIAHARRTSWDRTVERLTDVYGSSVRARWTAADPAENHERAS